MSRRSRRNGRRGRRGRRMQSRGVIGNLVHYIPGVGPVISPYVNKVEDWIVGLNNRKPPLVAGGKRGRVRAGVRSGGNVAAARSMTSRSFFKSYVDGTDMHCVGCDLVRPVPQNLTVRGVLEDLFSVIPANPAYWGGTRIAQIAPGYQQYRPLKFRWIYVPQVAVTQSGTVTIGTLWNSAVNSQDLQQTLVTSNGGCITQCYNQATNNVRLGGNLPVNLFELAGPLDSNTNPFLLLAGSQGTNGVTPGYFMIEYHYVFKNPIGSTWTFGTDWKASPEQAYPYKHVSAVVLSANSDTVDPGQIITLDQSADEGVWRNGDQSIPQEELAGLSCALFACTPNELDHGVIPDSEINKLNAQLASDNQGVVLTRGLIAFSGRLANGNDFSELLTTYMPGNAGQVSPFIPNLQPGDSVEVANNARTWVYLVRSDGTAAIAYFTPHNSTSQVVSQVMFTVNGKSEPLCAMIASTTTGVTADTTSQRLCGLYSDGSLRTGYGTAVDTQLNSSSPIVVNLTNFSIRVVDTAPETVTVADIVSSLNNPEFSV